MFKSRYGKLLIGFFVVMFALTAVSRAADSVTVARVYTEKPKQGTLAHKMSAEGTILASDQEYVRGEEGTFLKKIHVGEGQLVEKGDTLFSIDLETAADQLHQAESELSALRLNLRKAELERGGTPAQLGAVEEARRKVERAQADSDLNTEINGGKQLLADQRAVEDAKAALRSAEKQLAEASEKSGLELELTRLQIMEKERGVKRLDRICADGGLILAETGGTVGSILVKAGEKLTGGTLCTLIPENAEYVFEAELDDDEAEYLKIGDTINVVLDGRKAPLGAMTIKSMGSSGEKVRVTADLPSDVQAYHGMRAVMDHSSISQSYGTTIPLGALRGGEGSYFILTLKEKNTVLGNETVVLKQDVKLLDKDGKLAAIQEVVSEKVVWDSSKPIREGDRVREVEDDSGQ